MNATMTNSDKAFALARLGLPVFPCAEDKTPMTTHGFKDASTGAEEVADWWGATPDALVGVRLGAGLLVVDIDQHEGGANGFDSLEEHWAELPDTLHYSTRTGNGEHHVYRAPEDARGFDPYAGINVKANGGYAIWWGDAPESLDDLADAPAWALRKAQPSDANPFTGDVVEWLNANAKFGRTVTGEYEWFSGVDGVAILADSDAPDITDARLVGLVYDVIRDGVHGVNISDTLATLRTLWMREPWNTNAYRVRFDGLVRSAIQDEGGAIFTEPVPAFREVAEAEPEAPLPFRIVTRAELAARPKPEWLIDGVVQGAGVIVLAGQGGLGKSALVLGMAASLSRGRDWFGRKTKRSRVLYVAAEGAEYFPDRALAWELHNRALIDNDRLHFVEEGFNLSDEVSVDGMKRAVVQGVYDLVVLDTLSQLADVESENDNAQIARVMRQAKAIRQARPGTSVLIVHHVTKGTGTARGASAIRDNADALIMASGTGDNFTLSTKVSDGGKQKNAKAESWEGFALVDVRDPQLAGGASFTVARSDMQDPVVLAIQAVLADGEWHPTSDFLAVMGKNDPAASKAVRRRIDGLVEIGQVVEMGEKKGKKWARA